MKFWPTVAEMAAMSPMCSIMAARAMGMMVRMAPRSNLAMAEAWMGKPKRSAAAMGAKSTSPRTSART